VYIIYVGLGTNRFILLCFADELLKLDVSPI
jgi:hypothetical protein